MTTTLIIILGFTFIIFIHELGHFLAARRVGIHVETFSIGIGPRLFTLFKDEQGTEYILSALPLGGYVKMLGQEDIPRAQQTATRPPKNSFSGKTPLQRLFVVVAGVLMNFFSAYLLIILAYAMGVGFTTNKVGGISPDAPLSKSDLKVGEEIVGLNGRTINSFEDLLTATAFAGTNKLIDLSVRTPTGTLRTVSTYAYQTPQIPIAQLGVFPYSTATIRTLTAESPYYRDGLRNGMVIQQVTLTTAEPTLTRQTAAGIATLINKHPGETLDFHVLPSATAASAAIIRDVVIPTTNVSERGFELAATVAATPNYPAARAGIQIGDTITALNNTPVRSFTELQQLMQSVPPGVPLSVIVERDHHFRTLSLTPHYDAGSERSILGVTPALSEANGQTITYISEAMAEQVPGLRVDDQLIKLSEEALFWRATVVRNGTEVSFDYSDNTFSKTTIGIAPPITAGEKVIIYSLPQAVLNSFGFFLRELQEVYLFLGKLIRGSLPATTLGGPIAIFDTFQSLSAIKTFSYFLLLFAKISISLAIVNMLPIPLLDGGHAAFIGYELIRRRPAPERVVRTMNLIGFILLILLMIFVNYNDIMRILNR